jgi:intron-binding protein aquarius
MASLRSLREDETSEAADPSFTARWTQLAETHWLKPSKSSKFIPQVIKTEIWDILQNDGFDYRSLLALENLQILEKWVCSFVRPVLEHTIG